MDFLKKKMRILPMKRRFRRSLSLNIIDILKGGKKRATIRYFFIGSFPFNSESLLLFKGIVSKFNFYVNSS